MSQISLTKLVTGAFKRLASTNDGSKMYSHKSNELHKSTDGGQTFTLLNTFNNDITSLATDKLTGTKVVLFDHTGLQLSNDSGATWSNVVSGLFSYNTMGESKGIVMSASGQYVYIIFSTACFKSVDYGQTWSTVINNYSNQNLMNSVCTDDGSKLFITTNLGYVYTYNRITGIFSDSGQVDQTTTIYSSIACNSDGSLLYISGNYSKLFKSTNYGVSFTNPDGSPISLTGFGPSYDYVQCSSDGITVFVSNDNSGSIYKSTNQGITLTLYYTASGGRMFRDFLLVNNDIHIVVSRNEGKGTGGIYLNPASSLPTPTTPPPTTPPPTTPPTTPPPTTTYRNQNFYLTEEFDVSANGVTAATFDAEAATDVSGNYPHQQISQQIQCPSGKISVHSIVDLRASAPMGSIPILTEFNRKINKK